LTIPIVSLVFERDKHRLFEPVNSLASSLAAYSIAITVASEGSQAFSEKNAYGFYGFPAGCNAGLRCVQFDRIVRLPVSGPIEAHIAHRHPDEIRVGILEFERTDYEPPGIIRTLRQMPTELMQSAFIPFYENYKSHIKGAFGSDTYNWPDTWNFGRVIRNAMSHRGEIYFKNPNARPVSWRHLSYSPEDTGRLVIGEELIAGDLFILMVEMDDALNISE